MYKPKQTTVDLSEKQDKPKKQRRLTIKQRKFIDKVIETGNATESAMQVYDTNDRVTGGAIGYENLRKPQIVNEIENRLKAAKDMIWKLSQESENEKIRLDASKDIIDRVEGKPVSKLEVKQDDEQFEKGLDFKNKSLIEIEEIRKSLLK